MARRVNTKFLVIFSTIVLGGLVSAYLVAGPLKTIWRGNGSKKLIASGDALMKEADAADTADAKREKLEQAVRDYQQAVMQDTKNPELLVKLGDGYTKLTQFDINTYINSSRQMWIKALEIDPSYLPALRRLQDSYYAEVKIGNAQAGFFSALREKATAIHRLDPNDLHAHALIYIAPLNQWLASIETPASDVDVAITELANLIEKNPQSPEIADMVFFMAGGKVKRGIDLKSGGQETQGNEMLRQAVQTFQDAIRRQEKNADLHYRFYELLRFLKVKDDQRDQMQRYSETARVELERARELVSKDDTASFVKIYTAAHQLAIEQRQSKKAEQILLDLYNAKPNDQRVRLLLARFWRYDKSKQDEAVRLLELPIVDSGWEGVEAKQKVDLEIRSLTELATMYVERYSATPAAEKPEAMKRIKATYDKILAKAKEHSEVLKLRGRIEQLEGGMDANVKAIQTFERAQQQYMAQWNGREDLELTYLLARAYFNSRQTGQAKMQLLKYKANRPDFLPVRLMLAQVQIAEGAITEARDDVDFLEKQAPNEPDVIKLALAVLKLPEEQAKVRPYFDKLPESNRQEQMAKALIATLAPVNSPEEATRLYNLVLAKDGGDFEALQGMKDVLLKQGKKDEALALMKKGLSVAKEENARKIALVVQQLEGASTDKIVEASEALIRENFKDKPFELEIKLYEFNTIKQDKAEAFKHLQAAEKLKPEDGRVADLMFQYYLANQQWDKAEWYVNTILAPKNWDQANGLIYRFRLAMTKNDIATATDHARELTTRLKEFARSWIFYAQALQAARRFDDAIANYQVALEKQSENPEAIAGIITCYLQTNKPNDALTYIQRGMKAHPQNAWFKEQWKNYQLQWGDPALAIAPLREERDANPKDPNRWANLGRAQFAAARKKGKDWDKSAADAKATFTEALKQWPGEELFWQFLIELAQFNNDTAGAETLLKDMAARPEFKDTAKPAMMLADHYLRTNKPEQAEATMKAAVDRFKDNAKESGDVRRRLAAFYTATKRYDEALKLLDPSSTDPLVRQQIVEVYMMAGASEGDDAKKAAKFAEAERLLRGMLAATPNNAQLNSLLGVVLLNQKKEELAMQALDAALAQDPKNVAALFTRGQILLKSKVPQIDEAIKNLSTLRDVNPNNLEGRVALAEALRIKGQHDQAAKELSDALQMAPGRRDIRVTLVGLYTDGRTPSWGDAERLVNQAKELEPRDPLWPRMQAEMFKKRGMHQRAVEEIRAAMALDNQNAQTIKDYPRNGELVRAYFDILEAGKFYDQLLTDTNGLFATDKSIVDTGWWVYVKRAVAQRNLGKPREAMADFTKALDIAQADKNPSQDVLIAIIDKIREVMSNDAAIDRVNALANSAKGPQAVRWKIVLAYLYFQNNDIKRAVETIEDARTQFAQLDERNQMTLLNIAGTIYMLSNQYDKARPVYEELLAKRPDDMGALNNLAMIMAEHVQPPNLPKALEYSQRAYDVMVKKNVVEPNVLDTLGWISVLSGGPAIDTGIDHLKNSINAGEIAEAQYHLGEAYLKKNFADGAKQSFQRASQLLAEKKGPVDEGLKQKVESGLQRVEKALLEPRAGTP